MTASLRISGLATRTGFPPSTLRYYEQVGLLAATERSSGGYRLYDEAAVTRLRFIDRAKQLGLPLEEIRKLVAVWDGGLCAHVQDRLRAHVTAKSVEVRARVEGLTAFAAQLDTALAELTVTVPDGPCSDGCGCADPPSQGRAAIPAAPQLLELTPTRRLPVGRQRPAEVPVACTLNAADQRMRLAEWTELLALVEERQAVDGGVRLRFPPGPQLAGRLADLAAREHSCCAFFTFTLRPTSDALVLDVTAPADAAEVLANLFGVPA
jgi:DNA-binding transcriptional MerR regulator